MTHENSKGSLQFGIFPKFPQVLASTQLKALLATVKELNRRGWTTKRWTTKKGTQRGGKLFTKNSLYSLLTNVTYIGKIKYKDEVLDGEHAAIVPDKLFHRAQKLLQRNGLTAGRAVRNKHGALLRGLLRCGPCGCAMANDVERVSSLAEVQERIRAQNAG